MAASIAVLNARNRAALRNRDEILDRIWGEDRYPADRTVDNAIVRLRQSLGDHVIRSVRGVGYQFSPIEGADRAL